MTKLIVNYKAKTEEGDLSSMVTVDVEIQEPPRQEGTTPKDKLNHVARLQDISDQNRNKLMTAVISALPEGQELVSIESYRTAP